MSITLPNFGGHNHKKKTKSSSNLLEVQNAAKTMFANIRFQSIDKQIRTILFTSAVPDEGKTTSALYLAQAAATAGNHVLLVESDMRRRSLANMLDIHPKNGLVAVLTGSAKLKEAIVPTSVQGLYFLDAEPSMPNPADLLASKRMAQLNEHLAGQFDYVIYDTPPVGTFVDAAILGSVVDGAVLVVRPGLVKRQELTQAYEQLSKAEVNVIGICSTFAESTGSEYYYSYYTEGHSKKTGKAVLESEHRQRRSRTSGSTDGEVAEGRAGRTPSRSFASSTDEDAISE